MAEEVSLTIKLEDDYSSAAEQISESSRGMAKAMGAAEKAAAAEAKALGKLEKEAQRAAQRKNRDDARSNAKLAREQKAAQRESLRGLQQKERAEARTAAKLAREQRAAERTAQRAAQKKARDEARAQAKTDRESQKAAEDNSLFKQMTAANLAAKGIEMGISAIVQGIQAAISAAKQFGIALMDAFDFRKQAETSLGILTGGSGKAALARVKSLARDLGLSARDAAEQMQGLLGSGFSEAESVKFIKGLADLRALGISDQGVSGVQMAIGQIKGKGVLSAEEINQIAENSGGLIGRGKIYEQVAKARGITTQEAMKLANQGKISGDEGVNAVLASIQATTGGKLGSLGASAAGKTFGGVGNKFGALGSEFLDRIVLKSGPAMESMLKSLSAAADDAFKWLDSKEGTAFLDQVSAAVSGVTDMVQAAIPAIGALARGLAEGLGLGAGPAVTNMKGMAKLLGSREFIKNANDLGFQLGLLASEIAFLTTGLAALGAIAVAPFTMMKMAIDGTVAALQRLIALLPNVGLLGSGLGLPAAPGIGGLSSGLRGPQPTDFGTTQALAVASSGGRSGGGNTNSWNNSFSISVQGGGNDEELAAKISRAVRREIQNASASLGM